MVESSNSVYDIHCSILLFQLESKITRKFPPAQHKSQECPSQPGPFTHENNDSHNKALNIYNRFNPKDIK